MYFFTKQTNTLIRTPFYALPAKYSLDSYVNIGGRNPELIRVYDNIIYVFKDMDKHYTEVWYNVEKLIHQAETLEDQTRLYLFMSESFKNLVRYYPSEKNVSPSRFLKPFSFAIKVGENLVRFDAENQQEQEFDWETEDSRFDIITPNYFPQPVVEVLSEDKSQRSISSCVNSSAMYNITRHNTAPFLTNKKKLIWRLIK